MSTRTVRRAGTVALVLSLSVLVLVKLHAATPSDGGVVPAAGVASPPPPARTTSTPAAPVLPLLAQPTARPIPERETPVGERERAGIRFVDVTRSAGLTVPAESYRPRSYSAGMTAGIAIGELGGRTVTLLTTPSGSPRLFAWDGSGFSDITSSAGLLDAGVTTAAAFGDLNGDGHEDLVLGHELTGGLSIYLNDGHDRLVRSADSGIPQKRPAAYRTTAIRGIALGDVNGDGDIDIVSADWQLTRVDQSRPGSSPDEGVCIQAARTRRSARQGESRLYLGSGTGTFTDATRRWGLDLRGVHAFTPQLVDLDGDGRLDLIVTADFCTSRIFLNQGNRRFRRVSPGATAQMPPYGMGSVVTDLNGDGRPDWLATSISYPARIGACPYLTSEAMGCSGNRLYAGTGTGSFHDVTDTSGLRDAGWGWGVAAEDFANTGVRDVAITNGFLCSSPIPSQFERPCTYFGWDSTAFFVPTRHGYVNVARQVGLDDTSVGHALLAYDYDGDGRLDLLINSSEGPRLFRNVTPAARGWITVALHDPTTPTNPRAWGSRVEISSAVGTTRCWTTSTTSYETSWTGQCHAGLGDRPAPVTVTVWWPGAVTPQIYPHVRPNAVRTLTRS